MIPETPGPDRARWLAGAIAPAEPTVPPPARTGPTGQATAAQPPPGHRLELRHISKSFGGVHVLHDVNFRLGRGEVVGLLGDNGAGKSTLIKIVTGYHRPDSGELLFNDVRSRG